MSVSADVLDRMWAKFGMETKDGRDRFAYLNVDGKLILSTRRSHGRGKMSDNIATFIRQQMKLNEDQFRDAINCPMDRKKYIDVLKAKGLIPTSK